MKINHFRHIALVIVIGSAGIFSGGEFARADIRLPHVLGDHMVIQQGQPVTLWGWAEPGEKISVSFAGFDGNTSVDKSGSWTLTLPAVKTTADPLVMTISGTRSPAVFVRDILVGEVWVCSGQSNMEWTMLSTFSPGPEILKAEYPGIRLFHVPRRASVRPEEDVETEWKPCRAESVESFSAVAYYFGRALHADLGVPVGLINSSWGGTRIEPWTPVSGFLSVPGLAGYLEDIEKGEAQYRERIKDVLPGVERWTKATRDALESGGTLPSLPEIPRHSNLDPGSPTALYNGMIHPLIPFAIRGAIWYQGESNRDDGPFYAKKMEALINGWRAAWKLGDFPFYYVQLAPFNYGVSRGDDGLDTPDFLRLPLIWEAQTAALGILNTGMTVISDITDLNDIHPRNKMEVGRRLALWALAKTYGRADLVCSGPLFRSMSVEGGKIRIAFDHAEDGLMSLNRQPLTWFEISGNDRVFYKARAEIREDSVVVWSSSVPSPVAVRFAWNQLAVPNLGNRAGLPASPFRTDRW